MSQRRISELVGQSQFEVSEIFKGRQVMGYDVLVRIANGLGTRLNVLDREAGGMAARAALVATAVTGERLLSTGHSGDPPAAAPRGLRSHRLAGWASPDTGYLPQPRARRGGAAADPSRAGTVRHH